MTRIGETRTGLIHRLETRSSPDSFAATRRGFTFYLAHPMTSVAQIYADFFGTVTRIKLPPCLNRPDGISDTEGKLVAGNREKAPKRASLKVPNSP